MQTLERTAVIDFQGSNLDRFTTYLSDAEHAYLSSFRTEERKHQSLCARLCLKYVFLLQMSCEVSDRFFRIREEELNRFPAWLYREVCFIPGFHAAAPTFTWCGARFPEVGGSLSHSKSLCCGSLAAARGVGVDVESVEARAYGFYRDYFSDTERAWVADDSATIDAAWLFTVLWSLKECALKAAGGTHLTFSDLARIEVVRFPEQRDLTATFESSEFMLEPSRFSVGIRGKAVVEDFDCELAGDRNQVVVVVRQKNDERMVKHHDA
jgi:phosphopantetheinyl transferase (holo-ACP synthase)